MREPARFIPEANPPIVYVTHKNRSILAITQPRISGDTLHGTWEGSARPIALPLSQVQSIVAKQRNQARTTFLITGATAFTAVTAYLLVQGGAGAPAYCGDYSTWPPRDCP